MHWQADSLPLSHQKSLFFFFFAFEKKVFFSNMFSHWFLLCTCCLVDFCILIFYPTIFLPKILFMLISSVQLLICVRLFVTPWTAARQASLSVTNSWSLPNLMPIESVMPSSLLILCCPLLLLPPICPSIRVFSTESTLCMRWPKY